MISWQGKLEAQKKLRLFLTRGNSFLVLEGHLYLSRQGIFSRYRKRAEIRSIRPGEELFSRARPTRHRSGSPHDEIAILISGFGRFGNMVIQLANALVLAREQNIGLILYWNNSKLRRGEIQLGPDVRLKRAELTSSRLSSHPNHLLRTRAFAEPKFPVQLSRKDSTLLRQILSDELFPRRKNRHIMNESSLVIHLRSGDVFWGRPHPDYGQPPLSFYEFILDLDRWVEVVIVAEDETNPCFTAITNYCASRNIPCRVTGRTLDSALETIASATTIVMSRGTFVGSILWLNPMKRNVFCFGSNSSESFPIETASVTRIIDATGEYERDLLSGNWKNSDAQRALMLSYPVNSLAIEGESKA